MTLETAAIIACAYFIAAFVKGATGLGFSTSALPILALGIGLKAAMPLVIIPSLVSNSIIMAQAGHFRETLQRFWPMFVATLPGLVVGGGRAGRGFDGLWCANPMAAGPPGAGKAGKAFGARHGFCHRAG